MNPVQIAATESLVDTQAYRLGFAVLGPVFVAFAHLLYRHAHQLDCRCLAFVARDGDLLMRVAKQLPCVPGERQRPKLLYLHLSRRTTSLPAYPEIDTTTLANLLGRRPERETAAELLDSFGIPAAMIESLLAQRGIDPLGRARIEPRLSALCADDDFRSMVEREHSKQRSALKAYLLEQGIGFDTSVLMVDIGWRGTIPQNLHRAFAHDRTFVLPHAAYLALWSEGGDPAELPANTIGLVCDMRRSRNPREASAWYAAFLLEAICRADEGSTLGYRWENDVMRPVLAHDSESRRAESTSSRAAQEVRKGILAYVEANGANPRWLAASDAELRAGAQSTLFRLACFPTAGEIRIGSQLVHTETHAATWFAPLLVAQRPHPLRSPRKWLAGLSSPWRMGYVAATGGPLLSWAVLLADSLLLSLSPATYRRTASLARRCAHLGERDRGRPSLMAQPLP